MEFEDELARRGAFHLIYPQGAKTMQFLRCMKQPIYSNLMLTEWQRKYHTNEAGTHDRGMQRLHALCAADAHIAAKRDEDGSSEEREEGTNVEEQAEDEEQQQQQLLI